MRKLVFLIAVAALAAPTDKQWVEVHELRARFFEMNTLQIQVALEIQATGEKIRAVVKAMGCAVDDKMKVTCPEAAKK